MTAANPLPRRSAEEQTRLEEVLREVFEHRICFNELLGFASNRSTRPRRPFLRHASRSHRPLPAWPPARRRHITALDTVGGLAATVGIGEKFSSETAVQVASRFGRIGTIDLRVDYLHQGIGKPDSPPPGGSPVSAAASPRCR
jgi:hypothetical protein